MDAKIKLERNTVEDGNLNVQLVTDRSKKIGYTGNEKKNVYHNNYVDTNHPWTGIPRLLFRWKQSVYKLIWRDLLILLLILEPIATIIIFGIIFFIVFSILILFFSRKNQKK